MKILKRAVIGTVILAIILALALAVYLHTTKPVLAGNYSAGPGETKGKIVIERDKWGVPVIRTENRDDMFWAMGFVHASDRMFQMDLIRRLATGRLSEVFGRRALESDKEQKDLMIEEGISRSLQSIKPEFRTILESYCRGVNYYLKQFSLPPEFRLLGYSPEPWDIKDILAIFKRMEVILAGSGSELYNMKVHSALGADKAGELLSGTHGSTIINSDEYQNFIDHTTLKAAFRRELDNLEKFVGSNNWVVAGSRTVSGKPVLCNDPHLSNVFPSYFYQLELTSGEDELSGLSIAGSPFIVIGKNSKICWGVTNTGTDVIDYFILKTDPDDDGFYYLDGERTAFDIVEKKIRIKGGEVVLHPVKVSKFGPVMKTGDQFIARHSINEYPTTLLEAVYGMNFARNLEEFKAALTRWSSPAQNVVFADIDGNIGYYPTGLIPVRGSGDGSLPLSGVTIANLWRGFYDESSKPCIINPKKGFMATANNRVIPDTELPLFSGSWFPAFRGDRITELLSPVKKLSVEDHMAFQTDTYLKSGEFLMKMIKAHTPVSPGAVFTMTELKKWDLRADSGIGPLLFYRFENILAEEMFGDDLRDEETRSLLSRSWIYRLLGYPDGEYDADTLNRWADDLRTDKKENFSDIVERSLDLTHRDYQTRKSGGNQEWTTIHTLSYNHPLGSVFPLKYFLNKGPFGIKGGKDCLQIATFRDRLDFKTVHLSTFRLIIDMGEKNNSRMVNSSGQSGHFMSRFYDDQIGLYIAGKYRKFSNEPLRKYRIEIVPE